MSASTIFGIKLEQATSHASNTTAGTTTMLHKRFMEGCADYMEQHVLFHGIFTGVSGDSTLVQNVTCQVDASTFRPMPLDGVGGWNPWVQKLYNYLRTKPVILPGQFIPSGVVPIFPSIQVGWTQASLRGVAGKNGKEAHGNVMDYIGTCIRRDMQAGYIKSIPGMIQSYVGALSVTSIDTP